MIQITTAEQRRITNQQQPSGRIDATHSLSNESSSQYLVESFNQFHPPLQQVIVRQILLCPASQNFVQSLTFGSTEFIVPEIGVMDDLSYPFHPAVADCELLVKGLERAVLAAMAESLRAEHVKRNTIRVHTGFIAEDES